MPRIAAASLTVRARGPVVSFWSETGTVASLDTSPSVGLIVTTLLASAGLTKLPDVWNFKLAQPEYDKQHRFRRREAEQKRKYKSTGTLKDDEGYVGR